MKPKILAQGAEAIITQDQDKVIKLRTEKSYRLPELDQKIRRQRTKSESKLLTKAAEIIPVPKILKTNNTNSIEMQHIPGLRLSEHLDTLENKNKIAKTIGTQIAKLHNADIIHGDLTTSNMILSEDHQERIDNNQTTSSTSRASSDIHSASEARSEITEPKAREISPQKLFFIDFGLAFIHKHAEHKAVDLHLIKQALEAKHTIYSEELFAALLKAYTKEANNAEEILKRLEQVEKRGRYKQAY